MPGMPPPVNDEREGLLAFLQQQRDAVRISAYGLTDGQARSAASVSALTVGGLVKHLAGLEYGYLGESFGHPAPEAMSWIEDGSIWQGADMWAKPDESSEYITSLYRRACAHADGVIAALDLEAPGSVAHWPADRPACPAGRACS